MKTLANKQTFFGKLHEAWYEIDLGTVHHLNADMKKNDATRTRTSHNPNNKVLLVLWTVFTWTRKKPILRDMFKKKSSLYSASEITK